MCRIIAILLLVLPTPALAASAVSCHCFRDRSFDPGNPAAADPYVLATAQNSLLAVAFGTEKKGIVSAKMTGTPGEDLWVAHWAGDKLGLRPAELLDARARVANWSEAFSSLGVEPSRLGADAAELLARQGSDAALASLVVDDVLTSRLRATPEALRQVRSRGAADAATVAASILSRLSGKSPEEMYLAVADGPSTWGSLFHSVGVEPPAIEDAVRSLLR